MNLFQFLNSNNYVSFNRPLAHAIGLDATLFLSELLDKYQYFKELGQLVSFEGHGDGWFFLKMETVEERTTLGRFEQDKAVKKLLELGFIKQVNKGVPCKRYFQVQESTIVSWIGNSKNLSRMSESDKLDCQKVTNQYVRKSQTIKEPYKEPKEEPQSINQSPQFAATSWTDRLKDEIRATNEEIKMASERMKTSKERIVNPVNWMKSVILEERERDKEMAALSGERVWEPTAEESAASIKRIMEIAEYGCVLE